MSYKMCRLPGNICSLLSCDTLEMKWIRELIARAFVEVKAKSDLI